MHVGVEALRPLATLPPRSEICTMYPYSTACHEINILIIPLFACP